MKKKMSQLKDIHEKIDKLEDQLEKVLKMNLETLKNDIQQLIDDNQPSPSNGTKPQTNNTSIKSSNFLKGLIENKGLAKEKFKQKVISAAKELLKEAVSKGEEDFVNYLKNNANMTEQCAQELWKNLTSLLEKHLD